MLCRHRIEKGKGFFYGKETRKKQQHFSLISAQPTCREKEREKREREALFFERARKAFSLPSLSSRTVKGASLFPEKESGEKYFQPIKFPFKFVK